MSWPIAPNAQLRRLCAGFKNSNGYFPSIFSNNILECVLYQTRPEAKALNVTAYLPTSIITDVRFHSVFIKLTSVVVKDQDKIFC